MKKIFLAFLALVLLTGTSCKATHNENQPEDNIDVRIEVEFNGKRLGSYKVKAARNESLQSVEEKLMSELKKDKSLDFGDMLHAFAVRMPREKAYGEKIGSIRDLMFRSECIVGPEMRIDQLNQVHFGYEDRREIVDIRWYVGESLLELKELEFNSMEYLEKRIKSQELLEGLKNAKSKKSSKKKQSRRGKTPFKFRVKVESDVKSWNDTLKFKFYLNKNQSHTLMPLVIWLYRKLNAIEKREKSIYDEGYVLAINYTPKGSDKATRTYILDEHESIEQLNAYKDRDGVVELVCVVGKERIQKLLKLPENSEKEFNRNTKSLRKLKNLEAIRSKNKNITIFEFIVIVAIFSGIAYTAWYLYEHYSTKKKKPRRRKRRGRRVQPDRNTHAHDFHTRYFLAHRAKVYP